MKNDRNLTFGAQVLTYDLNGNLLNDGTSGYTWDARNRLAGITGPITATFQYDAAGRRTRKTINGVTTDFLHDGMNPVTESPPLVPLACTGSSHAGGRTRLRTSRGLVRYC